MLKEILDDLLSVMSDVAKQFPEMSLSMFNLTCLILTMMLYPEFVDVEFVVLRVLLGVDSDALLEFFDDDVAVVLCQLLAVQLEGALFEPLDGVVDEAHLIELIDDETVEDQHSQLLDLDVGYRGCRR